jgi:uncharacterized protein YgfB (UPF0149 family)
MGAGQRHGSDTPNKDTMMWIDSDDVLASDFDQVADLFLIEGIDLPPSQWHGCIVGLLVSGRRADELLGAMGHALQESITGDLMIASEQSAKASLRALRDPNYGFSPLIPDDDDELELRSEALASWCEGFLQGFAVGVAGSDQISTDAAEILRDMAQIARLEVDSTSDIDEQESDFIELVEYVRVVVLNLYQTYTSDDEDKLLDEDHELMWH